MGNETFYGDGPSEEEVIQDVDDYERVLHKLVDAYLKFEDDEEMVNTANESYERAKENKLISFDVELNKWRLKVKP